MCCFMLLSAGLDSMAKGNGKGNDKEKAYLERQGEVDIS